MFNIFNWLRVQVRDAFLQGIDDGVRSIQEGDAESKSEILGVLESRLRALPAPEAEEDEESSAKKSKAKR